MDTVHSYMNSLYGAVAAQLADNPSPCVYFKGKIMKYSLANYIVGLK